MHSVTATSSAAGSISGHSGVQTTGMANSHGNTDASAEPAVGLRDVEKSGIDLTQAELHNGREPGTAENIESPQRMTSQRRDLQGYLRRFTTGWQPAWYSQ